MNCSNHTINSERYCFEIEVLKAKTDEKRLELINHWGIMYRNYNSRLCIVINARQRLTEYDWIVCVISHIHQTSYSPSDFHLFKTLQIFLTFFQWLQWLCFNWIFQLSKRWEKSQIKMVLMWFSKVFLPLCRSLLKFVMKKNFLGDLIFKFLFDIKFKKITSWIFVVLYYIISSFILELVPKI